jgi:hypothetical protein
MRRSLFTEVPRETVRKVPKGLALKPHRTRRNGSKKLYFSAECHLNRRATDHSGPFSDGLRRGLLIEVRIAPVLTQLREDRGCAEVHADVCVTTNQKVAGSSPAERALESPANSGIFTPSDQLEGRPVPFV